MIKRIGIVVVALAVTLVGCGKEKKAGGTTENPAVTSGGGTSGTTTDNGDTKKVSGPLAEFVGTYATQESLTTYGYRVTVESVVSLTASQLVVRKTCTRAATTDYPQRTEIAEASAQLEVIDRNHFKLAKGITQALTLYIPDGSSYYPTPDIACEFAFPEGTYALDFIGKELVLGGPNGLVIRLPKP